jgi:hypothetical protein
VRGLAVVVRGLSRHSVCDERACVDDADLKRCFLSTDGGRGLARIVALVRVVEVAAVRSGGGG